LLLDREDSLDKERGSTMKQLNPYLTFDGNAREAMEFYKTCFGGELAIMTFADSPMKAQAPPGAENRVMHARLSKGPIVLMASDALPGMPFQQGNNFQLAISCEAPEESDRLFTALSAGGKVVMPLQETFWAERFGMLTDKFGVSWMLDLEKPQH
jgi:PhnB protein